MNMACSELTFRGTISTILLFLLCINYCRCEILSIDELEPIKNEEKQLYPTITNEKLGGNENAHKDDDDPTRAVELEHEVYLGDQVAQGGSGERFIAVPAHNLGATERLEPSLNGLGGIVSSNLPTGVRLLRVIEATREVVAGIRYDFMIEVADLESTDDPFVCHLALLERPWITTQWGDKERNVITTNCSLDATLTVTDTNVSEKDRVSLKPMSSLLDVEEPESDNMENNDLAGAGPLGNVIDAKLNEKPLIDEVKTEPNFDSIADSGQVEDILEHLEDTMTPERMKDIEDQIVRKAVEVELSEPIQEQVEEDIFIEPLLASDVQNEEQARVDDVVQEDSPQNEEIVTVTESQQKEETTQKEEMVVTEPVVVKKTVKIDLQRENPQSKLDALEGLKSWLDNVRIVETTTSGVLESVKTLQSEVLPHITEDKVGNVDDETVKVEKKTDNVEDATVKVDQQKIKLIDDFLGLTKKDEPVVEPHFVKVVVEKKYTLDVNTGDKKDIQVKENKEETSEESDEVKGAKSSSEESSSEENEKSKVKQANSSEKSQENKVKTDSADNSDSEEDLVISYLRRRKRSAPSKELVNRLANYAVNELDHIDTDNRKRIVLDVLDARQQNKKDGTYYLLKIKIGSTDCSESSSNSQKCIKSVIKNTVKICSLEVKKNGNEERVIKSHCVPFDKKIINRSKRQVPGGVTDASADDPYIQELISHTLSQLRGLSEDNANLNVIKVGPISRQVVQGILVRMMLELGVGDVTQQICEVDIWDRQWLPNGREVNTTCSDTENSAPVVNSFKTSVNRGKRDVFVGGPTTVDIKDSYIQELLADMMRKLRSVSDIYSRQKVIRTFDVTRQVVSGSLVKMTIEIGEADDVEHTCQVQIWDRPWLPDGREVKAVCRENKPNALSVKHIFNSNTIRSKRSVNVGENVVPDTLTDRRNVGVGLHVEPDDPYIQELAQHTVEQLKTLPDMNPELALIRVSSVYEKRIAGNYVVMTLELGKNKDTVETFCFAKIWDRIWRKNGREVIVKCGDKDDSNVSEHVFRSTVKSAREKRSLWFKHGYKHSLTISEQEKHHAKLFNHFIGKYNKRYTTQEYKIRIKIFKHNLNVINNLNQFEKGTAKYGVTQFADLTEQEFRQYTGLLQPNPENNNAPNLIANIPDIDIPENFDWRDKGAVSGVKNQGQCGSCWAFSVTGNIEGLNAIKTGKLEEFSEQELVDCDTVDQGCNGGLPDNAYKAIEELGGLELESDYPYEAHRDSCHYNKTMSRVRVSGAVDLPADETAMAKWLVANGPISIGINANAMQFYYGGVSHPWKMLCRPGKLDHGVLIVGYGVHDYPKFNKTLPYWIVKNSWGPNWGEQGYYRVFRGDGTCGVDKMATSAVLQGN